MIFPTPANYRSTKERLVAFAVLDCKSGMVICTKSLSWNDSAGETISGILKEITDVHGWPKCFCCDASDMIYKGLSSLLAREGNKSTLIHVLNRYAHSWNRDPLESFFRTLTNNPLCMSSQADLSAEHLDSWLDEMRVKFNSRRVIRLSNDT